MLRRVVHSMSVLGTALALMAVMALPAGAAELHETHENAACGAGQVGTWHLVANQLRGDTNLGVFTVDTDMGTISVYADHVKKGSQHLTITFGRVLESASSTVGGKLVLSDYTCTDYEYDFPAL